MSNVLIIHSGDVTDSLVATSLVRYFLKRNLKVHAALDNKLCDILSFANGLNLVPVTEFKPKSHYEIAINLSPCVFCADLISRASAESKFGYGITPLRDSLFFYNQGAYYHYLHKVLDRPTPSNLFQLTFRLAGLTWQGEGYFVPYFPKNRTKKQTGLAIKNKALKKYIVTSIKGVQTKHVPIHNDLTKQFDEINRFAHLVTDDFLTFHIALGLRKHVDFITLSLPPYKMETFGCGNVYRFDTNQIKENQDNQRYTTYDTNC